MRVEKFAPTVKETKRKNELRLKEINSKDSREREKVQKKNSEKANSIIDDLEKKFEEGLVSDTTGCSIDDIYTRDCTDAVLKLINDYLGGNWKAVFNINTGSDYKSKRSTSTLIVTPVI